MKNLFWIGNGKVVLPQGVVQGGSILVENGKIAAINSNCPKGVEVIDAQEGYVLPGFIDIHVHGGGGSDFMDLSEKDVCTVCNTHCAYGTTALVATTMTCSDDLLEDAISCIRSVMKKQTLGAQILGLHLEGPYFAATSKGAQPVKELRIPTRENLEHIIRVAEGSIIRWDAAPELPNMQMFAQVMKENGILCSIAHSGANATITTQAFDWGFSHITHFYNACTTFHKENGIVHSGNIEATYIRPEITIELIGDGRHIPMESMLLAKQIKGADKICIITDAMRAAGTSETVSILGPRNGGTKVVVKDNVAQLPDFSFYAGSIATMDRCLRTAHVHYGIPLNEVSRMLSLTPARLSGVEHCKGSLEVGKDADIVIMDKDFYVQKVFVQGILH